MMCEGAERLVAHAGKLTCDDVNIKELALSNRL